MERIAGEKVGMNHVIAIWSLQDHSRLSTWAVTNYKNRTMATIAERRKHQAQEKKKMLDKMEPRSRNASRRKSNG